MAQYVDVMTTIAIPKEMRENLDELLSPNRQSQYRGGIGQLQWLQMQGNPLIAYETSLLQVQAAAPNGHHLWNLNKTMRTAKTYREVYDNVVGMQGKVTWEILADAAWANRPDGSSTSGHLIVAARNAVSQGQQVPISLVSWSSRKIRQKVWSSPGAETQAFSTALEHSSLGRVFWDELNGDLAHLENLEEYPRGTSASALNDCKSLADALSNRGSTVSKTSEDKRLAIELSMIRQSLKRDETSFQWVDNVYMAADVLTKGVERGNIKGMVQVMTESVMTLKPTDEMLEVWARQREDLADRKKKQAELGYFVDKSKDADESDDD